MVKRVVVSEPLLATGCTLGEGSLWDARRKRLYFLDIEGHKIYTYEPSSGQHGFQLFERRPTALALLEDDSGLLVSFDNGPAFVPFSSLPFPPTNSFSSLRSINVEIPPVHGFNRFNEACVDPTGRRWMLGSMMHEGNPDFHNGGALYSIDVDDSNQLKAKIQLDDVTVANGMGWSRDRKTMYFTDSLRSEIGAYKYDISTGDMSDKTIFSKVDDPELGVPDGLCQDVDYGCWSARWGASKVIHFDEAGKIDLIVEFPSALNMTSCVFGGPNMDELFVTSAAAETPELHAKHPHSGHLFSVKGLGHKGHERTRFAARFT